MRILIASDQYAPMVGGVPTVTATLAAGLAGRGHEVAVLAPSPRWRGGPGPQAPVRVQHLTSAPWPWYPDMRVACPAPGAVRSLVCGFAPDVVHVHSPLTLGVLARRSAARERIPVVYTNHYLPINASPSAKHKSPAFDVMFYRYVIGFSNRCSHVTAPTATALGLLQERGLRAPSRVISNGVDLRAHRPGPPDARLRERYGLRPGLPVILSVSRLSPEKRIDVLLDAAARLAAPAQLIVAGSGPQASRLRARARELGGAGRVVFPGFVPDADLPGLYRLADVFAIASEAELQSLATMEAMASGLPVVAAEACALTELVDHGRNGFLVPPGRGDEMAAYLDKLICDPAERARMGTESLRMIASHERDRGLAEWESLYRALTAAAGAGRRS